MSDLIDIEDIEFTESLGSPRRLGRRVCVNPFEELPDEDFRQKYTFTKRFARKILDLFRELLSNDSRECPVSPEISTRSKYFQSL